MPAGSVGPALPPDLVRARERRKAAAASRAAYSSKDDSTSAVRVETPTEPEHPRAEVNARDSEAAITPKVVAQSVATDDEESEEDVGPQLLTTPARTAVPTSNAATTESSNKDQSGRPDWMLAPPSAGELSRNYNPLKSRGFAPKSSSSTTMGPSTNWTSVPGQDLKKTDVEREASPDASKYNQRQEAIANQVDNRGPSLVEQHNQKRRRATEDPDDPSQRPFDREKDIGRNTSLKRTKEFVDRSKDMKSMFTSGSYL